MIGKLVMHRSMVVLPLLFRDIGGFYDHTYRSDISIDEILYNLDRGNTLFFLVASTVDTYII